MRIIPFLISLLITLTLVIVLSMNIGSVPALGDFLSPQHGFWLNAEPVQKKISAQMQVPAMQGKAEVYFDDRMVPHVFADNDADLYFVQGFLHARDRLWQMEFQTLAAGGRLASVLGVGADSAILSNDRLMRRLGMVYGAENNLKIMEADTETKLVMDSYTAGINWFIDHMDTRDLPLEYRLLNYRPEHWSNLKTALFLMYMRYDLTGGEDDIELTNMRSVFNRFSMDQLFPITQDSLDPVIPLGTIFDTASVKPVIPADADSLYYGRKDSAPIRVDKPDPDNGSNNWAVAGSKTASGRPILCNDPHLGVSLPSLWYEMQLSIPAHTVYGVSFPGAPSIVIGFNDSIAWGVTNAMRDVKDYYTIQFQDDSHTSYRFEGDWKMADQRIEKYQIKGGGIFYDTVAYTWFGPVLYDRHFSGNKRANLNQSLAVHWQAHQGSNILKTFYGLNRAHNYDDYLNAIQFFEAPGQNFVFASKSNEIAIWQQANFPAKWYRQGDYIMPGTDSTYRWQGNIPMQENPHIRNPDRGFVSSANQLPVDTTYPYYIGGHHDLYRGKMINRFLERMSNISPADMEQLQNENENLFAETILPLMLQYVNRGQLNNVEKNYLSMVETWNHRNDPDEKGVTVFVNWFEQLEQTVWADELAKAPKPVKWPADYTLAEALIRNPDFIFIDNVNTPQKETLSEIVTAAFQKAIPAIADADRSGRLPWSKYKDSGVRHLLRLEPLSRFHLRTGGGENVINATKQFHAPSWRMVVHLTDQTEAYGVYPGGQSGNPGSPYYDNFVDQWAAGKYYPLWVMRKEEAADMRVRSSLIFSKP